MIYTNQVFTGTYNQCRDYLNASIPRDHPENWPNPDDPTGEIKWSVVEVDPVIYVPDLKTVKEQAQAELIHIFEELANAIAGRYPWFERDTWQDQEREALAYQADPNAPAPLLTGIATQRGITVAELAQRVIANAQAWRAVAPDLCGQRQAAADRIEAAATEAEVTAVLSELRGG